MTQRADTTVRIGGRDVGEGRPAYVVAELSGNHMHDPGRAEALVDAAIAAGADAIKLQTYTADTMTIRSDREPFMIRGTSWDGRNLYDLYEEAHTPWDWHPALMERARAAGLDAFSTPFDASAIRFLDDLDVPVHKVASFEIVDLPLLRRIAQTGKPVILSTGMSSLGEIDDAVRTLEDGGCPGIVLLKCTSAYPAQASDMNLRGMVTLRAAFRRPVGLSDHTLTEVVPVAAIALGACVIEKHITLRRSDGGPDAAFSLEPDEFAALVSAVRTAEAALGSAAIGRGDAERSSLVFRRSIFVVEDVPEGGVLTESNVRVIRPGHGLAPKHFDAVIGRTATRDLERGTPLDWGMFR